MLLDLRNRTKRIFGEDAFEWFSTSYLLDWAGIAIIWGLAFYAKTLPVTVRDSFSIDDPLIQHPHRKNQVSSPFNQFVALVAPSVVILLCGFMKRSLMDIHHGILGLLATRGLAAGVTRFLKNRIGRLRPDFLTRCEWDAVARVCTGNAKDITEGRRSFPSGHSTTAWSGMFYLSLFLAGQTTAWCFHSNRLQGPRFLSSRVLRFSITLCPLIWSTHVALSRMEDNRHHKEDVIVGSCIGIIAAILCYLIFWPAPTSDVQHPGQPRYLYDAPSNRGGVEFELAPVDDERNQV